MVKRQSVESSQYAKSLSESGFYVYHGDLPEELIAQLILRGQEPAYRANPRDNARFRDFDTVQAMLDDNTTSFYALQQKHALAGVLTLSRAKNDIAEVTADTEFSVKTFGHYGEEGKTVVNFARASLIDYEAAQDTPVDMWAELPSADITAIKRHRKVGFGIVHSGALTTLVRDGHADQLTK